MFILEGQNSREVNQNEVGIYCASLKYVGTIYMHTFLFSLKCRYVEGMYAETRSMLW